jgi:hypothetical protein
MLIHKPESIRRIYTLKVQTRTIYPREKNQSTQEKFFYQPDIERFVQKRYFIFLLLVSNGLSDQRYLNWIYPAMWIDNICIYFEQKKRVNDLFENSPKLLQNTIFVPGNLTALNI